MGEHKEFDTTEGALDNDRHERYCQEYVKDCNKTKAYIRSGYEQEGDGASSSSSQLHMNPKVKARIDQLQKYIALRNKVNSSDIAKEFMKLGYSNMNDFIGENGEVISIKELPRHLSACIQSYKTTVDKMGNLVTEIKLYPKDKSLQLLGQHIGWFEADNEQKKETFVAKIEIVAPK